MTQEIATANSDNETGDVRNRLQARAVTLINEIAEVTKEIQELDKRNLKEEIKQELLPILSEIIVQKLEVMYNVAMQQMKQEVPLPQRLPDYIG